MFSSACLVFGGPQKEKIDIPNKDKVCRFNKKANDQLDFDY